MLFWSLIVHLWGDYVFQSDWMALRKDKEWIPCICHVLIYTACFAVLQPSIWAALVIGGTHLLIDRFQLAKYLVFAKNHINPDWTFVPWGYANKTGYCDTFADKATGVVSPLRDELSPAELKTKQRPTYITVWLYIVTDNLLHITINALALTYL